MEYSYLYANKNFEEIKQKLYDEIQSALHKKYGENPDPLVLKRVKEEWNFLKNHHSIEDEWKDFPKQQAITFFAFMHDLGRWLRHNNYPYWNRGTGASSFILYLLDVTFVNPLPAHYHCPHCHQIYWKSDEYKDGFDLPPATKCKHDNTPLVADGHNIPWQSLFRYPTHAFHFDIDTVETAKENTMLFLEKSWLCKLNPNIEFTIPYPQDRPSIIWYDNLTIDCHIKGSYQEFFKTHIDNTYRKIALRAWKDIFYHDIYDAVPELPEPFTFADLVYNLGLNSSTGAWNENASTLIERFDYSPSDLIAFRDDVFLYFTEHHITERKAYVMSDQVRRGFLLHNVPKRLNIAKDKWVLKHIKNVESLFPKSHVLEWIFFLLKTRIKDEQEVYEKPYIAKNINVCIPYNLGELPIRKTDLQELSQTAEQMIEIFNNILEKYYRNAHMNLPMPNIIISTDDPGPYDDKCDICKATANILHDLQGLTCGLIDLEESIPTLAKHDYKQNNIILYIENIYQHFKLAPGKNHAEKLKAGLKIALAHALSTAILFYFMAETQELRKKYWLENINQAKPNMFEADVKGFGRWMEYTWCKHNLATNEIYSWQINNIKEEALQYSSPYYPYAESSNILLYEGEFMEDIYINGEATAYLKHNIERKDVLYWDEVAYQ